jgi:hypothetical protein
MSAELSNFEGIIAASPPLVSAELHESLNITARPERTPDRAGSGVRDQESPECGVVLVV